MKQAWKIVLKVIRILMGSILLLVGIVGVATPVLPGWILIIPGVLILAKDIPFFRRLVHWVMETRAVHWLENRFPQTRASLHNLRQQMKSRREARREKRQAKRAGAATSKRCGQAAKPTEGREMA